VCGGAQACQQFAVDDWLGQKVVHAGFERFEQGVVGRLADQEHDHEVALRGFFRDLADDRHGVGVGQLLIDQ
jgi:hypothetical protein